MNQPHFRTDLAAVRETFPLLDQQLGGHPLVYLDNAATTQKPACVLDSINEYYCFNNANIHRGVHQLATRATDAFETSRKLVRSLLNARLEEEIVFTSGTTESINLVAQTLGRMIVREGDEILVSNLEHHSNIVPWQLLAQEKKATIRVIPVTDSGELDLSGLDQLLSERTKILSLSHVSNSLGTINPIKSIIKKARAAGAKVVIDGAQAVAHFAVDVQDLDCDFYCFSGHKIYGPTGTGVLYGKKELLEQMPPWKGGGEMIRSVSFSGTTFNDIPYKFEAGTPNIEGVIGLGAAIKFIHSIGWEAIFTHEQFILNMATSYLSEITGIRIYGTSPEKVGVISLLAEGTHPYDVGTLLDQQGIAVRTGHHCTQPLWDFFRIPGTVRASFAMYTSEADVIRFADALRKSIEMLR